MLSRLVGLMRPWTSGLSVKAGLESWASRWAPAASAWESITGMPVDQAWLDAYLYASCAVGEDAGRDLAWVVALAGLVAERRRQRDRLREGEDYTGREVEALRNAAVAAVRALGPEGSFARARQVGIDRGRRPVPRAAR